MAEEPKESIEERIARYLPKQLSAAWKKAKSSAARADFLYELDVIRLAAKKEAEQLDKFQTAIEDLFIRDLPASDATGIAGKHGRIAIKTAAKPVVENWDKFYAYIKKTGSFEMMQRRLSDKAIEERWEAKKEVPGVGRFNRKTVSITKVK